MNKKNKLQRNKICVYAISKNEEQFVDRWMDSVSEADLVVVLDTGSTDKTVKKLKKMGAKVHKKTIDPWRFDVARNIAMSYIPKDVDICVSIDLDETFDEGWRGKLESAWGSQYTRGRYLYNWSFNEDGTPNRQFPYEKIHRRFGFEWVHPVHEVLKYSGKDEDKTVFVPGLILNHYPDTQKSREQYLPLLELAAEEDPLNDRIMFWLGREYMFYKKYDLAIETLQKHLALPTAVWDEERSASMQFIAACYKDKGNLEDARIWLFKAIAECQKARDPYLRMAELAYLDKDWPLVYAMSKAGLAITQKTDSYLTDPASWGYAFYDYLAISSFYLGAAEEALSNAKKACEFEPNNQRLKANLELVEQSLIERSSVSSKGDEDDGA